MDNSSIFKILFSFSVGVIVGFFLARFILKKQIEEAKKDIKLLEKKMLEEILISLGKKPKPEDLERYISRIENKNMNYSRKK